MGLFDTMSEPVVLKEGNSIQKQLEQMELLSVNVTENIKKQIENDKYILKYGLAGENAILFELKNSHIPMYILKDVFYEKDGLKCQIDFLIITRKQVYVIECKNIYGDIEVNDKGEFIRIMKKDKKFWKEGMYSPITQNQRHIGMIKQIRLEAKNNFLSKAFFKYYFDEMYKSIIVIANPKTIINTKSAPKEIKEKILKLDQLNNYIKKMLETNESADKSDSQMLELANFFLDKSSENTFNYTEKYKDSQKENNQSSIEELSVKNNINDINIEETEVYKALKKYRYEQSKKEKIKPYYIYNNLQLEEIIIKNPSNIEELKKLNGFGEIKCQKYGSDILTILNGFR